MRALSIPISAYSEDCALSRLELLRDLKTCLLNGVMAARAGQQLGVRELRTQKGALVDLDQWKAPLDL
jgi:hypothetical protein